MLQFAETERRNAAGEWESVQFEELRVGDVFRQKRNGKWEPAHEALTNPEPCEPEGNWGLSAKSIEPNQGSSEPVEVPAGDVERGT